MLNNRDNLPGWGALKLAIPGRGVHALIPNGRHEFRLEAFPSIGVEFKPDSAGAIVEADIIEPGGRSVAHRK